MADFRTYHLNLSTDAHSLLVLLIKQAKAKLGQYEVLVPKPEGGWKMERPETSETNRMLNDILNELGAK